MIKLENTNANVNCPTSIHDVDVNKSSIHYDFGQFRQTLKGVFA